MHRLKGLLATLLVAGLAGVPAKANVACGVPFTFVNNTIADATQVNANFAALITCLVNAASAGTNFDITALAGLTTALAAAEGGTTAYVGGTSAGTNTLTLASPVPTGFSYTLGNRIYFTAGATNNGPTTLNVGGLGVKNVFKPSLNGPIALTGNEIVANNIVSAVYDGVQFELHTSLFNNTSVTPVAGAATTYTSAQVGRTVSRSNSGAVMTDTLPGTGPGILSAGSIVTVYNNDASALLSISAGSGSVISNLANMTSLGYLLLGPGQGGSFQSDGLNYIAVSFPPRTRLGANTSFFVATTGSDSNSGLVVGSPFLTRQFAYNALQRVLDLQGFTCTFVLANGNYTDPMVVHGPFVGMTSPSNVTFLGNPATPANVFYNVAGGGNNVPFWGLEGAKFLINGVKVQATTNLILAQDPGTEVQVQNIEINTAGASSPLAASNSGELQIVGNLIYDAVTLSGGLDALKGGLVLVPSGTTITVTFNATPTFSSGFAASESGYLWINGTMNFSGTFIGTRYIITLNGVVNTGTGNVNFFPGTIAGTTNLGGQYN